MNWDIFEIWHGLKSWDDVKLSQQITIKSYIKKYSTFQGALKSFKNAQQNNKIRRYLKAFFIS
jgi:hypothetical protein